jgi:hypothetical protein
MHEPDQQERIQRLTQFAEQQVAQSGETQSAEMSQADRQMLDELGY